jgi:electron transport complex protein RnfB
MVSLRGRAVLRSNYSTKIFKPEDIELFCDLKLTLETPEQIAKRTGRAIEGLEEKLTSMWERGQIFGVKLGNVKLFKMVPWALGIYEFQLPHMDRELAAMCEEYMAVYGRQFLSKNPQFMQVIPIERQIPAKHESLTYERVSSIIENGKSFLLNECICKKEKELLDHKCEKPMEVCLVIAPVQGVFENPRYGRSISKTEAYDVLQKSEEAGLVHMTWNVESGQFFICNCCGCCCGILRGINELGIPASKVVNSHYYAEIDPDQCVACGTCADERCQVNAIEAGDDFYRVDRDKCIGCGLCVSTCPSEAILYIRAQRN